MVLRLVIDGYNFICASTGLSGSHPGSMDLDSEREFLLSSLNIYKRLRRVKITVVFDGARSGNLTRNSLVSGSVSVIFSRGGEEADQIIKEIAKKGGSLTVVTSDKELGHVCSTYGAVVIKSGEFYELLEAALYEEMKGGAPDDDEDDGSCGWGAKKGPARRASKDERKKRGRLKKL
jgi:predicted RNA-binding protein with PIN domain